VTTLQKIFVTFILSLLTLAGPLLNLLGNVAIPPNTPLGGKLFAISAFIALGVSVALELAERFTGARMRRVIAVLFMMFLLLSLQEMTGFIYAMRLWSGDLMPGTNVPLVVTGLVSVFIAALFSTFFLFSRRNASIVLGIALGAMAFVTVNKYWSKWYPAEGVAIESPTEKPALIHIVLDELIGLDGIPTDIAGGQDFKELVTRVFLTNGFQISTKAYSRHYMTLMSIPNLLNYDYRDVTYGTTSPYQSRSDFRVLSKNRHFEKLRNDGYIISVFQPHFIDFCRSVAVAECHSLQSYNPWNKLMPPAAIPFDETIAARNAISSVNSSHILRWLLRPLGTNENLRETVANPRRFDLDVIENWLKKIESTIIQNGRGHAYFIHLLSPHGPYELDGDCELSGGWGVLPQEKLQSVSINNAEFEIARRQLYEAYLQQGTCVIRLIDKLLQSISAVPELQNATIMIHGDHGSRLSSTRYVEDMTDRDMVDNYSTFFAVKKPGLSAGINQTPDSIQRKFADLFLDQHVLSTERSTVAIEYKSKQSILAFENFSPQPFARNLGLITSPQLPPPQ
jgi:hypothetical protein